MQSARTFAIMSFLLLLNFSFQGDGTKPATNLQLEMRSANIVRGYRPSRSGISGIPPVDLVKEPKYNSRLPKYGKMIVGNAPDSVITIVIDEAQGQTPRVYLDFNNDKDLTNDGDGSWDRQIQGAWLKEGNVKAKFRIGDHDTVLMLPYTFYRFSDEGRKLYGVLYFQDFGRVGTATFGGKEYRISLTALNNTGVFSNISDDALVVDVNQDGKLDTNPTSKEFFETKKPFNIEGESYRVKSVSVLGNRIDFDSRKKKWNPKCSSLRGIPLRISLKTISTESRFHLRTTKGELYYWTSGQPGADLASETCRTSSKCTTNTETKDSTS